MPFIGCGDRAITQDSLHCSQSAPGHSIHINHSVAGSNSRRAALNLRNCTSLALRPGSFCFILGTRATVVPGGLYLDTRMGQTYQHLPHHSISFCIRICPLFSTSVVLPTLRATAVLNPWFYTESSDIHIAFISAFFFFLRLLLPGRRQSDDSPTVEPQFSLIPASVLSLQLQLGLQQLPFLNEHCSPGLPLEYSY